MYIQLTTFIFSLVIVSGCVSVQNLPIEAGVASNLAGKQLVVVKRPVPDFGAMTPGRMAAGSLFGAVGGAVAGASMVSAGNTLVQENQIPDPSYEIAEEIGRALEARYGIKYIGIGTSVIKDDNPGSVTAAYTSTPLALDIRTYNWGFAYLPFNWNRYRVLYHARLRLIDTGGDKVIAEGGCSRFSGGISEPPNYDELVENSAIRLKDELKQAAKFCIQEFGGKYLGL